MPSWLTGTRSILAGALSDDPGEALPAEIDLMRFDKRQMKAFWGLQSVVVRWFCRETNPAGSALPATAKNAATPLYKGFYFFGLTR